MKGSLSKKLFIAGLVLSLIPSVLLGVWVIGLHKDVKKCTISVTAEIVSIESKRVEEYDWGDDDADTKMKTVTTPTYRYEYNGEIYTTIGPKHSHYDGTISLSDDPAPAEGSTEEILIEPGDPTNFVTAKLLKSLKYLNFVPLIPVAAYLIFVLPIAVIIKSAKKNPNKNLVYDNGRIYVDPVTSDDSAE